MAVNGALIAGAIGLGYLAYLWVVQSPVLINVWQLIATVALVLATAIIVAFFLPFERKRNFLIFVFFSAGSLIVGSQVFKVAGGGSLLALLDFYVVQEINAGSAKTTQRNDAVLGGFPRAPIETVGDFKGFLRHLAAADTHAYRFITPHFLLDLADSGALPVMPMAGIARTWTPVCNEGDQRQYPIIRADRFGFNNEDTVYANQRGRTMLVGDSYVFGFCVHQEQTIAGAMRRAGFSGISAGTGGSGPFTNFAILREYGSVLKPKAVAWLHFERNDFPDMRDRELRSSFLMRYLDGSFSQNLPMRQAEIDAFWKQVFATEGRWDSFVSDYNMAVERWKDSGMPTDPSQLAQVQQGLQMGGIKTLTRDEDLVEIFVALIREARDTVRSWGGEFYFVPIRSQLTYRGLWEERHLEEVMTRVEELGVPIVDVDPIIRASGDPMQFYPNRHSESHFNPLGYALIAREIAQAVYAH